MIPEQIYINYGNPKKYFLFDSGVYSIFDHFDVISVVNFGLVRYGSNFWAPLIIVLINSLLIPSLIITITHGSSLLDYSLA